MKTTVGFAMMAGVAAWALTVTPVQAQSGAAALFSPWPKGQPIELRGEAMFQNEGETDRTDDDIHLQQYELRGRWRQNPDAQFTPLAAFSWNYMNIDTTHPALPERLVEVTLLAGWAGRLDAQWQLGVFGGLGYAGNNAFGDHEAYYALADVVLDYSLDDVSGWQFFLSYKGNRAYLPDAPLPAVAYYNRRNDALHYALGLPASSVVWRPAERWTVHGRYLLPITVEAAVEYELDPQWTAFASYRRDTDAYHLDGDNENRRLLFSQSRLEAGLRWQGSEQASLTLAAGYAFDQEFERGFDVRDTDTVADLSDEPYLRLGLRVGF